MSALHEQERGADGVLRCTCQRASKPQPPEEELVGTAEAWRYNAALHNAMRREIERVATYAAAHERTHEWISDRLIEILDDPKAWMESGPRTWSLPAEPGPEVTAVQCKCHAQAWYRDEPQWISRGYPLRAYRWPGLLANHPDLTDASLPP